MSVYPRRSRRPVLAAAGVAVGVGALGMITTDLGPWYVDLRKPVWQPPDALFGPVWTLIFALAALSFIIYWGKLAARNERLEVIAAFLINGFLNVLWSLLFFRFERPEVARALGVTLQPAAKGVPIVYRLNFRHPESLFIANNLLIQPEDLLYIPVSDLTEAQKFFEVVDSVTQIGYNARITTSRNVP